MVQKQKEKQTVAVRRTKTARAAGEARGQAERPAGRKTKKAAEPEAEPDAGDRDQERARCGCGLRTAVRVERQAGAADRPGRPLHRGGSRRSPRRISNGHVGASHSEGCELRGCGDGR